MNPKSRAVLRPSVLFVLPVALLVSGCLDFQSSPAMGDWVSHTTNVSANETFPGSLSFVIQYWAGSTELPTATGLADRSTFRIEGHDLIPPGPGFSYAAWILVEDGSRKTVNERVGVLEANGALWLLERTFDPPRFVYSAFLTLEPVGTQSWRWTAFQSPTGRYEAEPGTYPMVASKAYRGPLVNLTTRAGADAWRAELGVEGVEPGNCQDIFREEQATCMNPPEHVQFCAWASGIPASASTLTLVGCRRPEYLMEWFYLEGQGRLGPVRVVVSMHSANETDVREPSRLMPIDRILCPDHDACTRK
jgi:hypothetical protein